MTAVSTPLRGRLAVVTGASSGIGAATARALAELGAGLILGARRLDRVEALATELRSAGASARALPLDVTDPASCQAFATAALADPTAPSILVNSAGLARGLGPVASNDEADWREMVDANLLGLMRITRLFLPTLVAQPLADLVQVGSVAGLQPYAGGAAYCATKAAVEAFSQALRLELSGTMVRQLVIEPGMVETEFSLVRFHGDRARAEGVYRDVDPLGPEDVAAAIAFALTRPPHVSVQRLLLMPTAQAAATVVHRRG